MLIDMTGSTKIATPLVRPAWPDPDSIASKVAEVSSEREWPYMVVSEPMAKELEALLLEWMEEEASSRLREDLWEFKRTGKAGPYLVAKMASSEPCMENFMVYKQG